MEKECAFAKALEEGGFVLELGRQREGLHDIYGCIGLGHERREGIPRWHRDSF